MSRLLDIFEAFNTAEYSLAVVQKQRQLLRPNMEQELKTLMPVALSIAFALFSWPATGADIYKCTDEHGNVAYLQLPCPAQKAEVAEPVEPDEDADDVPAVRLPPPSSRIAGEPLADCKKRYRDQIDAIDAELGGTHSAEQTEAYKETLLALAQQLRACG